MTKRASNLKRRAPPQEPAFDIPDLPDELLARLLGELAERGELPKLGGSAAEELESAFDDFLELPDPGDPGDEDTEATDVFANLSESLDQARIDANGGDPIAREALADFRSRLDDAISDDEIHPAHLIMLGKVLFNAGLPVGENLRESVGEAIGGGDASAAGDPGDMAMMTSMIVKQFDDPFDLYDEAASNLAAFPTRFRIAIAAPLVSSKASVARMAAIGFALHPDEELARAIIKAFPFSAAPGASDRSLADRFARIVPWLAGGRRELAQAALGALRDAAPAIAPPANKIVRILASTPDGGGSSTVAVCVKSASRFACVSVLMKPQGVAEVITRADLTRKDADQLMQLMQRSLPVFEIGAGGAARLLRLALGRGLSAKSAPPFRLVEFCEALSLGALEPDSSTPAEIIEKLLAQAHGPESADSLARAHDATCASQFVESWFEAAEVIDHLLKSTKSRKQAARKVLDAYLPSRRQFWADLCARTAFVLNDHKGAGREAWKDFALVGREIASQTPLDKIPLMRKIAEQTAEGFFYRR